MNIDINVAVVRDVINELIRKRDEYNEYIDSMSYIINDLDDFWKSGSSEQYIDCLEKTKRRMQNIRSALDEQIRELASIIREAEEAERQLTKLFGGNGSGGGGGGGRHGGR